MDDREAAILAFLLSADVAGIEALREQARGAVVTGMCPCGCATIDLAVDPSAATVSRLADGDQLHALAPAANADQDIYEVFLRLRDGWLSTVEIVHWSGMRTPTRFPEPTEFEPPKLMD